ncbi:UDP-N-acetylglucosamine--N-acetylmuramyl-(pentapeptide) pyrophosphoryl-undecaprenol N-acetylglucosamine transferase [Alloscardovia criceti]|uniref:UDP-N-acetylglucosamine--N-acetylmuramyl- (pentapeptide) pyrophosphoryl-undecaprenol N-acetylglucosamine transferase n=1 Tax=Alloscardovia criceti TaxID=356828 RepID=UPI0003779087|nr:UDP-N-acetylglucosamine--N-acetylmuramyl-(pentapeptide) pyrophosphoryl-undecaprenol N-acetylglucosamine transferase [Alloscardovia criceti]
MNHTAPLHIVLAGGGTAGHVNPLLSIAQAIRELEPEAQLSVIGTKEGLESRLVPAAGFELDTIEKVPFPRSLNLSTFTFPVRFVKQLSAVKRIFAHRKADVVVGVGGYAAAPAYVQAHRMRLPLVIHEQNARAGMANKLGARWAHYIGVTYDNCGLLAGKHGRMKRVGLPLRAVISQRAQEIEKSRSAAKKAAAQELGLNPDIPIIVVTGGSLGALNVNTAVANACRELLEVAQIVHLTGKDKSKAVRKIVKTLADEDTLREFGADHVTETAGNKNHYYVSEYWEGMDALFAAADLVICRSGAGTVAELTALGVPAVYVPLAIGNGEQIYNAQPVAEAGGGIIVQDHDFNADWIKRRVIPMITNESQLDRMSEAAWKYGKRDAAQKMARKIIELAYAARK